MICYTTDLLRCKVQLFCKRHPCQCLPMLANAWLVGHIKGLVCETLVYNACQYWEPNSCGGKNPWRRLAIGIIALCRNHRIRGTNDLLGWAMLPGPLAFSHVIYFGPQLPVFVKRIHTLAHTGACHVWACWKSIQLAGSHNVVLYIQRTPQRCILIFY